MGESLQFLFGLPGMTNMEEVEQKKLGEAFREVVSPPQRFLYREGEAAPGVHVLVRGYVKLTRSSADGRELVMSLAGPGDVFGPCCDPFTTSPASCTSVTMSAVRVLVMPALAWRATATASPVISRAVVNLMMASRRGCTDLASRLAFQSVEQRLASLLRSLTRWSEGTQSPVEIPPLLTQSEMAQALGTAREVVTRCLARFEDQGLIRRRGRRILLPDPSALAAMEA